MYELNRTPEQEAEAVIASAEFAAYVETLAAERVSGTGDDLLSDLVAVREGSHRLSTHELVATAVLLLNAGHEASVNVTGNGWWALFRNPDQLSALRADRSLLETAVDELMRYDTPLQMFERWVLQDMDVHGVTLPRGSEVALLFGSANHDPAVFHEPSRLDLARKDNPHLSFGAGIHYCLGANLARAEMEEALTHMAPRMPGLALDGEPAFGSVNGIYHLDSLPLRWAA